MLFYNQTVKRTSTSGSASVFFGGHGEIEGRGGGKKAPLPEESTVSQCAGKVGQ